MDDTQRRKQEKRERDITIHTPMYLQLREVLRTKIENEEFGLGQAIPSENALAKQYGLNRMTVRNAISALINEGLLISVHGKGVYVIGNKEERILQTEGGFQETYDSKDPKWESKVLVKSKREAGPKYARIFKISESDEIYFLRTIQYLNGEPYSIEESHIPAWVAPTLDKIDLSVFSKEDIYRFNDIRLASQAQSLSIGLPDAMDARMLKIPSQIAVLILALTNHDVLERVVEYTRVYTRADRCNFKVRYRRARG